MTPKLPPPLRRGRQVVSEMVTYIIHFSMDRHLGAYPANQYDLNLVPTMTCIDLQALPFDVLVLMLQFLDTQSLLMACLTSQNLREIATPLLYEVVQLGPSPRCFQDLANNVV